VSGIVFREIDRVRVKGKDTAISIFEPLGPEGDLPRTVREQLQLFEEALELYRSRDWEAARQRLSRLTTLAPEARLYRMFIERIDYLRANPPGADWDGARTFETK
jgi:adenylate cyclase